MLAPPKAAWRTSGATSQSGRSTQVRWCINLCGTLSGPTAVSSSTTSDPYSAMSKSTTRGPYRIPPKSRPIRPSISFSRSSSADGGSRVTSVHAAFRKSGCSTTCCGAVTYSAETAETTPTERRFSSARCSTRPRSPRLPPRQMCVVTRGGRGDGGESGGAPASMPLPLRRRASPAMYSDPHRTTRVRRGAYGRGARAAAAASERFGSRTSPAKPAARAASATAAARRRRRQAPVAPRRGRRRRR